MDFEDEVIGQRVPLLPRPFGMGERWYMEARRVKEVEAHNWTAMAWKRWKRTFVREYLRDLDRERQMWDAWADWMIFMDMGGGVK